MTPLHLQHHRDTIKHCYANLPSEVQKSFDGSRDAHVWPGQEVELRDSTSLTCLKVL